MTQSRSSNRYQLSHIPFPFKSWPLSLSDRHLNTDSLTCFITLEMTSLKEIFQLESKAPNPGGLGNTQEDCLNVDTQTERRKSVSHPFSFRSSSSSGGFLGSTSGKELACQCRSCRRLRFKSWVRKIPWRFSSVQFSHSVVSDSLRPHGLQHSRPPCPSPTPRVHPNPCPLSW